jgi:hypothetical protein
MRYLSILFLSLFSTLAFPQSYLKDLVSDKVTVNGSEQTVVAYLRPVKEVEIAADRFYHWYSANQINRTQGGFSGKLLNGQYTSFYRNKNLKEQGEFKKGLQHGPWKSWYENGQLRAISKWRWGMKSGRFEEFTESGLKSRSGRYAQGELQGKVRLYTGKDSSTITTYKDGSVYTKKAKKGNALNMVTRAGRGVKGFVSKLFKKKNKAEKRSTPSSTRKKKETKPK